MPIQPSQNKTEGYRGPFINRCNRYFSRAGGRRGQLLSRALSQRTRPVCAWARVGAGREQQARCKERVLAEARRAKVPGCSFTAPVWDTAGSLTLSGVPNTPVREAEESRGRGLRGFAPPPSPTHALRFTLPWPRWEVAF